MAASSDLRIVHLEDIGPHYATTLARWREQLPRQPRRGARARLPGRPSSACGSSTSATARRLRGARARRRADAAGARLIGSIPAPSRTRRTRNAGPGQAPVCPLDATLRGRHHGPGVPVWAARIFATREPPMKTRITELFGIQHPIIQGGMHFVGLPELASAVSNAGGLGMITGAHARHAGEARGRDRALPRDDRQAVRRQPDLPAGVRESAVRRTHPGDRRGRRAHRRDRRPQPGAVHAAAEAARREGHPQVHVGAPFAQGRAHRLRRGQRRRLRVRRPSGRGRRAELHPAAARRRGAEDPVRRLGRHGRRSQPGRGARARARTA